MKPLEGKVAVVAGATRGAGRAIAVSLGEAGAIVYCTGRSVRGSLASGPDRPETIDETAEMIGARGGMGISVQVDHSVPEQVKRLFERVGAEQGKLDVLVNDIWGGEKLIDFDHPFWEQSLENGLLMQRRAIHTHIITSYYGVPLMLEGKQGLVIEVTELKYQSLKQTLTFATEASVSLTAKATSGNEHYDRVYNAGEQKTGALMPDERERAETVNKIVGMALEDMLNDPRLVAVLTQ